MATDLLGWTPDRGDPAKIRQLLKLTDPPSADAFDLTMPGDQVAHTLFKDYFMPYAEKNWPYDGASCNCEDLANAFVLTYLYIKQQRNKPGIAQDMPIATNQVKALEGTTAYGFITKPLRAVGGLAHGNVRPLNGGGYDGRCYFPNHTFARIGTLFYDPTFGLETANQKESIGRLLMEQYGVLRLYKGEGKIILYACDGQHPAPRFSNSWWELNGEGFIAAQAWVTQTARIGHSRSKELQAVDAAIKSFEDNGYFQLMNLKLVFQTWIKKDPNEAKARNKGGCVNGLAKFLGVLGVNYPNV